VVKDAERTLREKAMAWALRQVGGADAVALADRIEAAL
jgi:3-methyladenine DNA glycosylase AlkD